MKRYVLVLLSLMLVTAGLIWSVATRPSTPTRTPAFPALASDQKTNGNVRPPPLPLANPESPVAQAAAEKAPPALPLIPDPAKARNRIDQLSATSDEAHVAELAGYLAHPSAEVRGAAMEGLVLLGAPSAVPLLRAAAMLAENEPAKTAEAASLWSAVKVLSDAQISGEPKMTKLPLNTASPNILRKRIGATAPDSTRSDDLLE